MRVVAFSASFVALIAASSSRGEGSPSGQSSPPAQGTLAWEEAFDTSAAPPSVHFRGSYTDGKGTADGRRTADGKAKEHRFEVWREKDARIVRNTDDRLVLYAERAADGSYVYKLVDKARRLLIDVRQENLYRLGRFSDWTSLSTMLQKPSQAYRIVDMKRTEKANLGACQWFRVEIGPKVEEVCWSKTWGLPVTMREAGAQQGFRFKIDAADRQPNAAAFRIDDKGLVAIHADEDIHPASD